MVAPVCAVTDGGTVAVVVVVLVLVVVPVVSRSRIQLHNSRSTTTLRCPFFPLHWTVLLCPELPCLVSSTALRDVQESGGAQRRPNRPRALIILPSRELCAQARKLSRGGFVLLLHSLWDIRFIFQAF
jgi:hypothetical protein